MIIFSYSLLFLLLPGLLNTFVTFTTVTAAPIPVPNDVHTSVHSHGARPPTSLIFGPTHTPKAPSKTPIGSARIHGSMPVHQDAQHSMTEQQLRAHAHHIATQISEKHGAPYVVHASHIHGHQNVSFTAIRDPNGQHVQHPEGRPEVLHVPKNERPHIDTPTLTADQQRAIHQGLAHNAHHHTAHDIAAQPGVHGEGKHGKLLIDPAHQDAGLTPDQLKVHAQYVAQKLFPHPQNHDVRVEVKHRPGDAYATYHAVTADGGVITHYPPPTPAEKAAIRQHVASTFATNGGVHDHGSSHVPGQRWTFTGGLPAHPNAPHHMSPDHMKEYSSAIKDALKAQYATAGTPEENAHATNEINSMAMTSIHHPGTPWIGFSSQPRAPGTLQHAANTLHPDLANAHTHPSVGHTMSEDPTKPNTHAESKVLDEFLKDPGIAAEPGTAHEHLQGVSIGVSGQGDKPCSRCHKVLAQFPVHYQGMGNPLPQGVDRAIELK